MIQEIVRMINSGEEMDGGSVPEFNELVARNKIISISLVEIDQDDETYLFANLNECSSLEIPLKFKP